MEDIKKLFASARVSAMEFGEIAKLHTMSTAEEAKKQGLFYQLGKKYYELYKDSPEQELKSIVDKLIECDENIADYKEQIANVGGDEYREVVENESEFEETEADAETKAEEVSADVASEEVASSDASEVSASEEISQINKDLEAFLDEKSYERKLDRLILMRNKVDKEMLETMAVSLDIELSKDSVEEQYEEILECLKTMEKYECSRLRGF